MNEPTTVIGHVVDVQGGALTATLVEDEQGAIPAVTIGDEDVTVGQIGAYVEIRQGELRLIAIVTRVSEQEVLASPAQPEPGGESVRLPFARRTARLTPIGTLGGDGTFGRGVGRYPTTGAEVHALGSPDVATMFEKYRTKGYAVGTVVTHGTLEVHMDPTSLFGRHVAILGQTGAGKSWAVASLVQRAVQIMPRAHIVILDLHGEYSWVPEGGERQYAFSRDVVRHIDARELEMPYWLMTYAELCDLLIDRTEFTAHNQLAFFRDTLRALREQEKEPLELERVTVDTPVFFSLDELMKLVEEKNSEKVQGQRGPKNGPLFGVFDKFLMRLQSRLNDVRYDFLFKPQVRTDSGSMSGLLRDFVGLGEPKCAVTIVDLSSVPFDVRPAVAAQVGRLAFEFNYWNEAYRDFPLLLLCEEAHIYIPRDHSSQFAGSRKSMERIAKEGRKYGVGLGVVSQRPHELSETVLAQCGSFLCLRITNPADQSYVRALVPESEGDLVAVLAGLGRGEALALGEAVPIPTRVQLHLPDPPPNSEDVDFHAKWKEGPEDIDVDAIVARWRRQER